MSSLTVRVDVQDKNPISHPSVKLNLPRSFPRLGVRNDSRRSIKFIVSLLSAVNGISFGIHREQCVRNTTVLPQFETRETCHSSLEGRKGAGTAPECYSHTGTDRQALSYTWSFLTLPEQLHKYSSMRENK